MFNKILIEGIKCLRSRVQKNWPKLQQRSFVGWKYRPYQEKNQCCWRGPSSRWNFSFKVEHCASQLSVNQFLFWNIWQNWTRPFFIMFCSKIEKENRNIFIWASTNLSNISIFLFHLFLSVQWLDSGPMQISVHRNQPQQ